MSNPPDPNTGHLIEDSTEAVMSGLSADGMSIGTPH